MFSSFILSLKTQFFIANRKLTTKVDLEYYYNKIIHSIKYEFII